MLTVLKTPVVVLADERYLNKGYTLGKEYIVWAVVNDAGTYRLGLVNDAGVYTFEDFYLFKHTRFEDEAPKAVAQPKSPAKEEVVLPKPTVSIPSTKK